MRAAFCLFVSAVLGCSPASLSCGAGTAPIQGVCTVLDASNSPRSDVGTITDGRTVGETDSSAPRRDAEVVIDRDDTLLLEEYPRRTDVEVVPGSLSCLVVRVLRRDGRTEVAELDESLTRIEFDDPTIAKVVPWDDCRGRTSSSLAPAPGIVGLAAGTTRARLTVEVGGARLTAQIGVRVLSHALSITAEIPLSLPTGQSALFTGAVRAMSGSDAVQPRDMIRVAPSLFRFEIDPPDVVDVVRDHGRPHFGFGYQIRATRQGHASVRVTYREGAQLVGSFPISVTEAGELVAIPRIVATLEPNAASVTGFCHRVHARGLLRQAGGSMYEADLENGVVWQPLDRGMRVESQASRALLCASEPGESRVRACVGPVCTEQSLASFSSPVVELRVAPERVSGTTETWDPGTGAFFPLRTCVPINVELVFADGSRFDATRSPLVQYRLADPAARETLSLIRDAAGIPQTDAGSICFAFETGDVCPTQTVTTVDMSVTYAAPLPPGPSLSSPLVQVRVTNVLRPSSCSR